MPISKNILYLWFLALLSFAGLSPLTIAAELYTNIQGTPVNNQGKLTYQIPLDLPKSIHGLAPEISVSYIQGSSKGNLGSGSHLNVGSAIERCADKGDQGLGRVKGGITVDSTATYCLDGKQLISVASNEFRPAQTPRTKVVLVGSQSAPTSWEIYDETGYKYEYISISNSEAAHNTVWKLATKEDKFSNKIEYSYGNNQRLEKITYPGFEVKLEYSDWTSVHRVYSNGVARIADNLVDKVAVYRNQNEVLSYQFRFESYTGFNGIETKRLKGVKRCQNTGIETCSKELTLEYQDFGGYLVKDGHFPSDKSIVAIPHNVLDTHIDLSGDGGMPNFFSVDIDLVNGEDICFYSVNDSLVCAISDGKGGYKKIKNEKLSQPFGYTVSDFKYFAAPTVLDINNDLYPDLCIADNSGLRCAQNENGTGFKSPVTVSTIVSHSSGFQFLDINQDTLPDLCAVKDDTAFTCYENLGDFSFSGSELISIAGDFSSDFETELYDSKGRQQTYKQLQPIATDVSGDGIPDVCHASAGQFKCMINEYSPTKKLQTSGSFMVFDLYKTIPQSLMRLEPTGHSIGDAHAMADLVDKFKPYKNSNEQITLTVNYVDVNSDGLVDICYVEDKSLKCAINAENGFLSPVEFSDLTDALKEYGESKIRAVLSSINYADYNADGLTDICYMDGESQYCAFNNGSNFSGYNQVLGITSDVTVTSSRDRVFGNYIQARFDEKTHIKVINGLNVYGNRIYVSDHTGDGRTEFCTRTINGFQCYENTLQNYYSLLASVTDGFGNQTKFTFENTQQGNWYTLTSTDYEGANKATPSGLVLTKIESDTGVGTPGSSFETVTYSYEDLLIDQATLASGYAKITQKSTLSDKEQTTSYYTQVGLFGRVKSVEEKIAGKTISKSENTYSVGNVAGISAPILSMTENQVYDPVAETELRSNKKEFKDLDSYGYPKKTIETKSVPAGDIKTTTTVFVYDHNEDLWVLGRPASQSVTHNLTNKDDQTKKVSFKYYDGNHALHKQVFEEGSAYEKTLEFTYYPNGLKKSESITALVDETDTQTRTNSFVYDSLGNVTSQTDALGNTSTKSYHATCLALEKKYDIAERLVLTNTYDPNTCRLIKTTYSTGKIVEYDVDWVAGNIEKPAVVPYENEVLIETRVFSNTGEAAWEYTDRQGRTIKTNKLIAKSDTGSTMTEEFMVYNDKGLLTARSRPVRVESGSRLLTQWVNYEYDDFARNIGITATAPDGSIQTKTISYVGLTTNTTFNGSTNSSTVGVLGKPLSVTKNNKTLSYSYTAIGEVETTTQNEDDSTKTKLYYDKFGFKYKQESSDTGTSEFKINGFGEVYWRKDANNQIVTNKYDAGGRKYQTVSSEGASNWYFHEDGNGLGQLDYSTSYDGVKREFVYDSKGRVLDEYFYINNEKLNRTHYSYDAVGRMTSTSYNHDASDSNLVTPLHYEFDQANSLSQVKMPADKLKSYDYKNIQIQYEAAIAQILEFDSQIKSIQSRMNYHSKKLALYEGKIQYYNFLKTGATADVEYLERAKREHQGLLGAYETKAKDLREKAKRYGGLNADRKYVYKGYDSSTGIHTYAYQECTERVRRALFFTRCNKYENGMFGITQDDFKDLTPETQKGKICTIKEYTHNELGITNHRTGKWVSYLPSDSTFIESYTAQRSSYNRRCGCSKKVTVTLYKYNVCDVVKRFNVHDIFSELATKYEVLANKESGNIDDIELSIWYKKNAESVLAKREVTKYKDTWVVVASNPIVIVSTKVPYEATEEVIMKRPEALKYYSEMIQKYQGLREAQKKSHKKHEADKSGVESKKETLENAKKALLEDIEAFTSLSSVKEGADAQAALAGQNLVLWAALSRDTSGKVKDELFGNGLITTRTFDDESHALTNITTKLISGSELSNTEYAYTADGNLDTKKDIARNLDEDFTYLDNQLDTWTMSVNGSVIESRDYEYDALGNITRKQGLLDTHTYSAASPYSLTNFNSVAVQQDDKGYAKSLNGKTYSWNTFGKATSISGNGVTTTFKYDSAQTRAVKTDAKGTTYYISPTYERLVLNSGDIIHRYHIRNDYETTATVERYEYAKELEQGEVDSRPQDKVAYYNRDILGSGLLVTGSRAQVLEERHYTPFGEKITFSKYESEDLILSEYDSASVISAHLNDVRNAEQQLSAADAKLLGRVLTVTNVQDYLKGFTSHESLDDQGLVHMNARLYDPEVGRFASPDSIVPDASNPLAFNRYAYVYNNPALMTDPSGHNPWAVAAAFTYFVTSHAYSDNQFHHIASAVLVNVATANAFSGVSAGLVAGGTALATSSLVSGKIGSTEIRSAIFAAVSAEAANAIGHGGSGGGAISKDWATVAAAHGLAQGTIGWFRDKNFWTGFVSGLTSHAVGHHIKGLGGDSLAGVVLRTSIVSGTAAIVASATGGDAAHAALTAAIVHLYNAEQENLIKGWDKFKNLWFGDLGGWKSAGQYFSDYFSSLDRDIVQTRAGSRLISETSRWSGHAGAAMVSTGIGAPLGAKLLTVSTGLGYASAGWDALFHSDGLAAVGAVTGGAMTYARESAVKMVPAPMKSATEAYMYTLDRLSQEAIYQVGNQ